MLPDGIWPVALVPVIAGFALATRAMSRDGALAGGAVGLAVTIGAGWPGFAMLATLLFLGTLASGRTRRNRGALQALCNGGAAAVAALLGLGTTAIAGALATALSDTVAGEWGRRFGGTPRRLLFGPPVPAGTDGGMTVRGTLFGLAAAPLVPLAGALCGAGWHARTILFLAAAGFTGNLIDSVLGWLAQPRLGPRGNDWTNLLATTAGALLATGVG